ncbi:9422e340-088c-45bc-ae00-534184a7c0d4 [Thermothielavioides terrestris]|uniref:9422e340-088c-45bc-ae00-534184a7c0d4 n=1 Tax=Thermothielavioides terrestris TaxID=2587410 RepID=A0A3S4B7Z9_9PEZI|nr:9422e340-088c-45bc-ae00-534184a7c0d4 [Thermothielavioides terrestris]
MSTKRPLQPNKIDREFEKEVGQRKLEARPEEVTTSSSVRRVLEGSQAPPDENPDVMVGIKSELNTVKETFALATVPREAYALGLAGTLPYLGTSLSTLWLAWSLNTEWPTRSIFLNSFLFSHDSATHWLQILEPLQIGYGAVIISFLGAIHWGLEFGEKQPNHSRTRFRYGAGVLAPAMAWPTIFMPTPGWAPTWYGTYRFVLTAVVGVALLISLVGRAKVGEGHIRLSTGELAERIKGGPGSGDGYRNWAKEEEEERKRIQEEKKKEEKKRKEAEKKAKEEEQKKKRAEKEIAEGSKSKQDSGNRDEGTDEQGKKEETGGRRGRIEASRQGSVSEVFSLGIS